MPERAASKQEIQRLFAVTRDLDAAGGIQLLQRPQGELDIQRAVLDQENVDWRRGSGAAGQRGSW
jgi:hypothetical protein